MSSINFNVPSVWLQEDGINFIYTCLLKIAKLASIPVYTQKRSEKIIFDKSYPERNIDPPAKAFL
jgi:hypothetical protein